MFGRSDPFFKNNRPHSNPFLESLHRTYGQPTGALPKRDDAQFQRALDFRKREKDHYAKMEQELAAGKEAYALLMKEQTRLADVLNKLSKAQASMPVIPPHLLEQRLSKGVEEDELSEFRVRAGASDAADSGAGVGVGAESANAGSAGDGGARVPETPVKGRRQRKSVSKQVLQERDLGGSADQHAEQGPEHGGGAVEAESDAVGGGGGQAGEE
tara:strand:+ start:170 stop:811 length:642 start_codon:yes stop_codon:yes gene_type:complete